MLTRRLLAGTVAAGMVLTMTAPALGDRVSKKDPNDFRHRLDIRRVVQSHGGDTARVRHKLASYGTWRSRVLRKDGWRIAYYFSIDKNTRDVERRIVVRRRGGTLQATYYAGRHGMKRQEATIWVRRPDRRSVTISFEADLLQDGIRAYRWWAEVYEGGPGLALCESGCADVAPNRGSVRHVLE